MFDRRALIGAIILVGVTIVASPAYTQEKSIVVASTTSTQDSGLFEYLLPIFKQKTGITVKVLAQGTGRALDTARRGDADVVFVHDESAEEEFLAEGEGVKRFPVMYNDFVLIGPKDDPAGIKGMRMLPKPRKIGVLGTSRLVRVWELHSILLTPIIVMCCLTVGRGSISRTKETCRSWLRATSGCSINTPSCW